MGPTFLSFFHIYLFNYYFYFCNLCVYLWLDLLFLLDFNILFDLINDIYSMLKSLE